MFFGVFVVVVFFFAAECLSWLPKTKILFFSTLELVPMSELSGDSILVLFWGFLLLAKRKKGVQDKS